MREDTMKLSVRFLIAALAVLLPVLTTAAQDPTPEVTIDPMQEEVEIVGDPESESLHVVRSYLETGNPNLMAEDANYFDQTRGVPLIGRDMIDQTGMGIYDGMLNTRMAVPLRYIVADNVVVVEFLYYGTAVVAPDATESVDPTLDPALRDQDMMGVPAIGIYEVEAGQIVRATVYYDHYSLQIQHGVDLDPYAGGPYYTGTYYPDEPMWVGDITNNLEVYHGQTVTVDGYVGRALGDNAFVLYQDQFLGGGNQILVVSSEDTDFIQLADTRVRVTGTVHSAGETLDADDEGMGEVDWNDPDYAEFDGQTVIFAKSITNVETVMTIGHIIDNPDAFIGQMVTVNGRIGDTLTPGSFMVYQDQLIGVRGRVLVVDNSGQTGANWEDFRDNQVRVHGTVYRVGSPELQDMDINTADREEGEVVIIADEISIAE
jgi:hypothetical protein